MIAPGRSRSLRVLAVCTAAPLLAAICPPAAHSGSTGPGGVGLAPSGRVPAPPGPHSHGRWLRGATVTEYWPATEQWFAGRLVTAPGMPGRHRIDWLYSADGISMQGQGIGLDGHLYHLSALGSAGWVTAAGKPTTSQDGFSAGPPFWRAGGYWRGRRGRVTFPLQAGGWSAGRGRRYLPLKGIRFGAGPSSSKLHYYRSIAVDPSVIPLGSRVYIPAFRNDGYGGWFLAQDTGGAIRGRHVDVYRRPPSGPPDSGALFASQRIYVIKPHARHR